MDCLYYNTSGYEKKILELRKDKQGLKRIMKWYIEEIPVLDELVLLADILVYLYENLC